MVAYAAENRFTEERLGPEACDVEMRGRSVQFTIDVTGQPETDELRIIGIVRLEYPDDPARPGSDDDFLVRTSLYGTALTRETLLSLRVLRHRTRVYNQTQSWE